MIASVEKLIRSAGFAGKGELMGQHSGLQTVRMALTEAEAAAIEASTTQYCVGDVFLICDVRRSNTLRTYADRCRPEAVRPMST